MSVDKKTLTRIFFGAVFCIVLYWLLHETDRVGAVLRFFKDMFSPFVAGAILAFILNVPMRGIENRFRFVRHNALRRAIALALTFIMILVIIFAVFYLLIPQVVDTIIALIDRVKELLSENPTILRWLKLGDNVDSINWMNLANQALSSFGGGIPTVLGGALNAIGSVYTGVFNGVIAIVFSIYCLARKDILARQFKRLAYSFLPEKFCDSGIRVLRLTNRTFSNFISGQFIEACILGCLFAVAMTIFRFPYIPLISVLIGVTALIPIVGAFVGCVLGALFILVVNPMQAVWFVVMFLIIQQIENNVIYPKVVGKSVGLPGMWVLVSVTVGGALMGVIGMLLMIPVVSVVYTLLREITSSRLEKRGIDPSKLEPEGRQNKKKRCNTEPPQQPDVSSMPQNECSDKSE